MTSYLFRSPISVFASFFEIRLNISSPILISCANFGEVYDVEIGENGLIYITSEDQYIRCIDTEGEVQWEYSIPIREHYSLKSGPNGSVFIVADHRLNCIGSDGKLLWAQGIDISVDDLVFDSSGLIFMRYSDSSIICLHPNGTRRWRWDIETERTSYEEEWSGTNHESNKGRLNFLDYKN